MLSSSRNKPRENHRNNCTRSAVVVTVDIYCMYVHWSHCWVDNSGITLNVDGENSRYIPKLRQTYFALRIYIYIQVYFSWCYLNFKVLRMVCLVYIWYIIPINRSASSLLWHNIQHKLLLLCIYRMQIDNNWLLFT